MEKMDLGERARGEIEVKMEEAHGCYEMGFPVLSKWTFFNVLTWYITHRTVSVNQRRDMEKQLGKVMAHTRRG